MHPAYSVIVFTTASGAGYGLLALLGLWGMAGGPVPGTTFGLVSAAIAFGLVTLGLLSSTYHLGRPERAWRAFSQWRSSWLSREGVAAVITYPIGGAFVLAWTFPATFPFPVPLLGLLTVLACIVTVVCTAMIYNSLQTIRQWCHPLVVPVYLVMAFATGASLLMGLVAVFGLDRGAASGAAAAGALAALFVKYMYWQSSDADAGRLTAGRATGLGNLGPVRQWEGAHTGENYVNREMGYRVARHHAKRLRAYVLAGMGLAGLGALLSVILPGVPGAFFAVVAPLILGASVLVERWLFFAEAEHVVTLFYGAARA